MACVAILAVLAGGLGGDPFPPLSAGIGHPRAVTVTRDGRVLLASSSPNALFEIARDGLRVLRFDPIRKALLVPVASTPAPEFAGVAACPDGAVYLSAGPDVLGYEAPDVWRSIPVTSDRPRVTRPAGLACDGQGRLVIADPGSHRVWRFDPRRRALEVLAGIGLPGDSGDGGPAAHGRLSSPEAVAIAPDGTIFIVDRGNRRLRWIRPDATIGGNARGSFVDPTGVAVRGADRIAVADAGAHRVYEVRRARRNPAPLAGNGTPGWSGDAAPARLARLRRPWALAAMPDGGLLVADSDNRRLRTITPSGRIVTVAGNGGLGYAGDGGPALSALVAPTGLALDARGNLYVVEAGQHRIRRIDQRTGVITTVAGSGLEGDRGDGGPASQAELSWPSAVVAAPDGTVYVGDTGNRRVRRVSPAGTIDTLIGGHNEYCCQTRSLAWLDRTLLIAEHHSLYRVPVATGKAALVWSRVPTDGPALLKREALERIDSIAASEGAVYVGSIHPGAIHRLDLTTGVLAALLEPGAGHPGVTARVGPTSLALASPQGPLLFANLFDRSVYSFQLARASVDWSAAAARAAEAPGRGRQGVTAVAASENGIYFADAWRIFRVDASATPQLVAGGGRGF